MQEEEQSVTGRTQSLGDPFAGRRIVHNIAALIVLISAIVISGYVGAIGTDRLPTQLVRFALTVALAYALRTGRSGARWLTIVLMGLAGIVGLLTTLVSGAWLMAIPSALYAGSALMLLAHRDVVAFYASHAELDLDGGAG